MRCSRRFLWDSSSEKTHPRVIGRAYLGGSSRSSRELGMERGRWPTPEIGGASNLRGRALGRRHALVRRRRLRECAAIDTRRSTDASAHPVLRRGDAAYPDVDRLLSPTTLLCCSMLPDDLLLRAGFLQRAGHVRAHGGNQYAADQACERVGAITNSGSCVAADGWHALKGRGPHHPTPYQGVPPNPGAMTAFSRAVNSAPPPLPSVRRAVANAAWSLRTRGLFP